MSFMKCFVWFALVVGILVAAGCSYSRTVYDPDTGRPLYEEQWEIEGPMMVPAPRPGPGETEMIGTRIVVQKGGVLEFSRPSDSVSPTSSGGLQGLASDSGWRRFPLATPVSDEVANTLLNEARSGNTASSAYLEPYGEDGVAISFAIPASQARVVDPFDYHGLRLRVQRVETENGSAMLLFRVEGPTADTVSFCRDTGFTHIEYSGRLWPTDTVKDLVQVPVFRRVISEISPR